MTFITKSFQQPWNDDGRWHDTRPWQDKLETQPKKSKKKVAAKENKK